MSDLLYPAFLKLNHANEHFTTVANEVRDFLTQHPLEFTAALDSSSGWQTVRVGDVPELPRVWGVILGDGVHDCRSALDNAVAALIRLAGGNPDRLPSGRADTKSAFPILVDEPESERENRIDRALGRVLRAHRTPILEAQPFLWAERRHSHPLAVLQELSNADKHRLVHIPTLLPRTAQYRLATTVGNNIAEQQQSAAGFLLEQGREVLRLRVEPDPAAPVAVDMEFQVEVQFTGSDQRSIAGMPSLADIYMYLYGLVKTLIPLFERYQKVDVPSNIREQAGSARFEGLHIHDGTSVTTIPAAPQEQLLQQDGTHTYRLYGCPACGVAMYAEIAGDIRLE